MTTNGIYEVELRPIIDTPSTNDIQINQDVSRVSSINFSLIRMIDSNQQIHILDDRNEKEILSTCVTSKKKSDESI